MIAFYFERCKSTTKKFSTNSTGIERPQVELQFQSIGQHLSEDNISPKNFEVIQKHTERTLHTNISTAISQKKTIFRQI